MSKSETLKNEILNKVKEYYSAVEDEKDTSFTSGKSRVNYAGRVFDEKEMTNLVDSSLEFWLTYGRYSAEFEKKLAEYLGVKWSFLVNSGSSANLLAFMTLTSPLLKDRAVKRGDEVITVAAGFPTTVAPIIQYGAIPVFVDVDLETFNIDVNYLDKALSSKTKAVMVAHTLGNPFNLKAVSDFCKKNNLWLIEDNCDALGSKFEGKFTGTWGDMGTSSFYPPHHMTMGEGGAVYTDNPLLKKIMLSIRDWGRDCWCDSGVDNTCKHRFSGQYGTLPFGYDHKYVYSHFGYNLKATDMQAAIGCAQLEKFPSFVEKRKENFAKLYNGLKSVENKLILPKATEGSDPSWFGFLMTLRDDVSFKRNELAEHLEKNNIQTRNLFAGNITRHPCFDEMKEGVNYRVAGDLKNTDKIMNDSFWVGLYPGMKDEAIDFMIKCIVEYIENNK
ncbi:MAG: lipopolysaccharide biosynthesis protein RfbH [Spirochaetae bacterium HGW-Spirochaetae-5]|nr:MAG: lipopolysaccharide biosynthesis protein RfbH [Spirochaetae bacterium HGW-Spirochaetae-5]